MGLAASERERYQAYLCGREWGLKKEAVRARCGGICERCKHFPMYCVHHLTYVRKYNERLEDLQALCEGCHEFIHGKREHDPRLNAPVRLKGRVISSIYLAGRINERCDWRGYILYGWQRGQGDCGSDLGSDEIVTLPDGREIKYIGPRWKDLTGGHGTFASSAKMGPHAYADEFDGCEHGGPGTAEIIDTHGCLIERLGEIHEADLVFAWIDSRECFGTLAEIGFSMGIGKIIVVAMPKRDRELWFAARMAHHFIVAPTVLDAWHNLWNGEFNSTDRVFDHIGSG